MFFSYPSGTVSEPFNFSIEELHQLKPLMKAKCIRSDHEFENSFNEMMSFRLNKTEAECAVIYRDSVFRPEALKSYPTKWLAQKRDFSNDLLVFFTDKLVSFLSSLYEIENDPFVHYDFITFQNNNFVSVHNIPEKHLVQIELFNMVFECSHHENLPKTLAKLQKYTDRFIEMLIRSMVTIVAPNKPTIDAELGYALLLKYNLASFGHGNSKALELLSGVTNLGLNHYERRSYVEPRLIEYVERVKTALNSDFAPSVMPGQFKAFCTTAYQTLNNHVPLKPKFEDKQITLNKAYSNFSIELSESTWQYISQIKDCSTEKLSTLTKVA